MSDIRIIDAVKEAMFTALRDKIDIGNEAGAIDVYKGTRPTLPSTAANSGDLLGTLRFSDPCCATVGSPTAGRLTMGAITQDSSADQSGTATWARISSVNSGVKTTVMDLDVTVTGGGGALQLNTTAIVVGGPILITAFEFTL